MILYIYSFLNLHETYNLLDISIYDEKALLIRFSLINPVDFRSIKGDLAVVSSLILVGLMKISIRQNVH